MSFLVQFQVTFTDPGGKALDAHFLRSKAVLSLLDASIIIATKEVVLQENQMEVEWIVHKFETTANSLTLKVKAGRHACMQMYRQVQGVVGTMWVGIAKVVWVSV